MNLPTRESLQLETALLKRIIERNDQILALFKQIDDMHNEMLEQNMCMEGLEMQLRELTGESIKEDEHGADTSPR